jgi:Zn-dependent protease
VTILQRIQDNPLEALLWAVALLISVILHEYGHAWVAIWQGDDTPLKNGRFDWNPMRYLDWTGILLFLLIGFGALGYVKTQPWKYRNPVWGSFAVSMAGIVMNIALVLGAALILRGFGARAFSLSNDLPPEALGATFVGGFAYVAAGVPSPALYFVAQLLSLNVILAVFNALPIPPLDGAHALAAIAPGELGRSLREHMNGSWWLLIAVIVLLRQPLSNAVFAVERFVVQLLIT